MNHPEIEMADRKKPTRQWDATHAPDEQVQPGNECPKCGEKRMDFLVWDDDGTKVKCSTCSATYTP